MKKKRPQKTGTEPAAVNEPSATYGEKRITFFNSFEEMNEYDHRYYASLSPEESLSQVTMMRLHRYPFLNEELNPWGNKIYMD